MKKEFRFDKIGYWSEVKLDIIKEYAAAYSKIMSTQDKPSLYHIYIDAFAGPGIHWSKNSSDFVPGSPTNALDINPKFREYHFIDLDKQKVTLLEGIANKHRHVFIYPGDCNHILLKKVFPQAKWEKYRRALCILDPYGLDLDWEVLATAGNMESIDIFLNFPVTAMNRNVLWKDPKGVSAEQIERMNKFWGDNSWRDIAYTESRQGVLFGERDKEKSSNKVIAEAFRKRLQEVAGFKHVPEPIPMRNKKNTVVYYLFFASQKPVAENIVKDIFRKYRNRRGK